MASPLRTKLPLYIGIDGSPKTPVKAQFETPRIDGPPRWHAFLSHAQATAGDQCLILREALLGRGAEAWLDVDHNTSAESSA